MIFELILAGDYYSCNNEIVAEECYFYAFCLVGGYCECNFGYKGDGKNDCKGNIRVCVSIYWLYYIFNLNLFFNIKLYNG